MTTRRAWAGVIALIAIYLVISLDHLDVYPIVHQDEPLFASASYKLANEGIYGTDLLAGYYGMERHVYFFMPAFPLLEAAVFTVVGAGVRQMRLSPVLCGALVLLLAFFAGTQLHDHRVGLLAVLLLLGLGAAGGWEATGIPLLDLARVNRPDIGVPVFGLAALVLFNRAGTLSSRVSADAHHVGVGVLLGLACLTHLYAVFWGMAFGLFLLHERGRQVWQHRATYLIPFGFFLAVLPWIVYVASGWTDYLGQRTVYADRFDLLDPSFYRTNLLTEYQRYRAFFPIDPGGNWQWLQIGTWVVAFGLPAALVWICRRERGRILTVAVMLIVPGVLFALLLSLKMYNYLIALWPLVTLILAWAGVRVWDRSQRPVLRWALLTLLAVLLLDGGSRIMHRRAPAAQTSPYLQLEQRIAEHIPDGSRVLGPNLHWLGLRQYPYRSWAGVALMIGGRSYHEDVSLAAAVERANPDIILIDRGMASYFDARADPGHPDHGDFLSFQAFIDQRGVEHVATVEDSSYGAVRILRVSRSP